MKEGTYTGLGLRMKREDTRKTSRRKKHQKYVCKDDLILSPQVNVIAVEAEKETENSFCKKK